MKKTLLFLTLVGTSVFGQTITHSKNTEDIVSGSVTCGVEKEGYTSSNTMSRTFNLSAFNISKDWTIKDVDFGFESVSGDLPFTVTVSKLTGTYPGGTLTTLGTQDFVVGVGHSGKISKFVFDTPIVVPAGSSIVVSYSGDGEEEYVQWYPASNGLGETSPSYITAPGCKIDTPSTFASIGYPKVHLIMSVTGEDTLGITETIGSNQISLSPNPVIDMVTIKLPTGDTLDNVQVYDLVGQKVATFKDVNHNLGGLKTGVYIVKVQTKNGATYTQKIVKK